MTSDTHVNPWLIAVSVMFATFMEVLDTTVVNVSLPHIAGSLSATIDEATWALTSYLVANAIILPMTGWLASVFGRKRLLMLSVVGFTGASFLCGLAPTLGIADRLPHHPGRDRRRAAAAVAGGAARGVPAAGSRQGHGLLGARHRRRADPRPGARRLADRQLQLALGLLHQHPGRHRVDRDDASCSSSIRRTCAPNRGRIDYWGIGMLAVGIGALQIVLDKGQEEDWFASTLITVARDHQRRRR